MVEIWFVGSGTLPSGTITFPDGVVMFGGGGGVLPFVATVAGGVEPVAGALLAAGTPADGFFATRARGFLGLGAGALAEVVFVDSVAGATVVVVSVVAGGAGLGASNVGASAWGVGTTGFFFLHPEALKISAARESGSTRFRIPPFISSPFQPAR